MLDLLKQIMGLYIVVPVVALSGIYLSYRLRWLQIFYFWHALRLVFVKNKSSIGYNNALSSFGALAAVLGGNLGTGNIAGIAVALSLGGPGSLFWMFVMAILGAIVKFTGCYLGIKYRVVNKTNNGWVGGPMYYIKNGLKNPVLANLFCLLTIISSLTVGNLVQINSVALPLISAGISPLLVGILMAVLVAIVLWGKTNYFSTMVSSLVPFMAIIYLVSCFYILGINYTKLLSTLNLIITSAINIKPVIGGIGAYYIGDAIRVGFDRGLFATDAGVGIAPILHSQVPSHASKMDTAFNQGLISVLAPIIVVFLCLITGMVLLVTGAWQITTLESTNVCIKAFEIGFNNHLAGNIVIFTLFLFALTTVLTWAYCAQFAVAFISNDRLVTFFKIMFVLFIPVGTICQVKFIWTVADVVLNLMLLVNLFAVISLSKQVVYDLKNKK